MFALISSTMKAIWKKMARSKAYRDAYVSAHIADTVSSQIFALRESLGWTQTELAVAAGMKQSRISDLEDPSKNDNFEIKTLKRIASAADVGLDVRFIAMSDIVRRAEKAEQVVPQFKCDALERGTSETQAVFVWSLARSQPHSHGRLGQQNLIVAHKGVTDEGAGPHLGSRALVQAH